MMAVPLPWRLKGSIVTALGLMPGGERVYHALQRLVGTTAAIDHWGAKHLVMLMQQQGREPAGRTVLEIGTGWHPVLPLLCSLGDARRVVTLDINPWLDWAYARATLRHVRERLDTFAPPLTVPLDTLRARCAALADARSLRDFLDAARIDYRCPADAVACGLPDASMDVVVSSNVLEHVPPRALEAIHREMHRVLRPGGLAIHRIDLSDHFSHNNARVSALNFLKFSEEEWRRYGGGRLGYQNRLRPSMHIDLFRPHFRILDTIIRRHQATLDAIRAGELALAPEFGQVDPEDLAGEKIVLVGEKA